MDGTADIPFFDTWLWLIIIIIGLVLIITELLLGVDTGLDLVFIGSAFVLGGLITFALDSWVWTAVATGVICIAYIVIGRRYFHRLIAVDAAKTNIDTIIGKSGIVHEPVSVGNDGLVKVDSEYWKARSDEIITEGELVTVTAIKGVTVTVRKKAEGDN